MNNKQNGFTLFEVLISMFIAGVALLGLVMLELNILRSSQSSFNYTLATIEANTLIDKTWRNLCEIHGTNAPNAARYTEIYNEWRDSLASVNGNYTSFSGATSSSPGTLFLNDSVVLSWTDKIIGGHDDNNKVTLNVPYPNLVGKCK